MASVQHLEKLRHIQRIFASGDTLEAAVGCERVSELIRRTEELMRQRANLREERRRLRIAVELVDERKRALAVIKREDFLPPILKEQKTNPTKRIRINISGLMFEISETILQRDPKSLLAELTSSNPPMKLDPDGEFFYFDREWWLFRYIVIFLREGELPDDRPLLAQLYKEAAFWRLRELQRAIETERLHLHDTDRESDNAWWRRLPNYWKAVDEAKAKAEAEEVKAAASTGDWWTGTAYNGKLFFPLSEAVDKNVLPEARCDPASSLRTTYAPPTSNENKRLF